MRHKIKTFFHLTNLNFYFKLRIAPNAMKVRCEIPRATLGYLSTYEYNNNNNNNSSNKCLSKIHIETTTTKKKENQSLCQCWLSSVSCSVATESSSFTATTTTTAVGILPMTHTHTRSPRLKTQAAGRIFLSRLLYFVCLDFNLI